MKRVLKIKKFHPNFFLGLLSYLLLITGVVLKGNEFPAGRIILFIAIAVGGFHWIYAIIDVISDKDLKKDETSQYFWLAIIIMIPPVSAMLYYLVKSKKIEF